MNAKVGSDITAHASGTERDIAALAGSKSIFCEHKVFQLMNCVCLILTSVFFKGLEVQRVADDVWRGSRAREAHDLFLSNLGVCGFLI